MIKPSYDDYQAGAALVRCSQCERSYLMTIPHEMCLLCRQTPRPKAEPQGYRVIIADPPWSYNNSGCHGAAENHYSTMSLDDICAIPVKAVAAPDAVLFLWATWPQLIRAQAVIDAWGFEYVTGFPWIKIVGIPSVDLWGDLTIKAQYGVGFWVRGCTEPLLIARRGNVSPPVAAGRFVGLLSENLRHSRKPENLYHIAETLPGPYLELFARRARPGWDVYGNQVSNSAVFQ